jgi:hypothetical protein
VIYLTGERFCRADFVPRASEIDLSEQLLRVLQSAAAALGLFSRIGIVPDLVAPLLISERMARRDFAASPNAPLTAAQIYPRL